MQQHTNTQTHCWLQLASAKESVKCLIQYNVYLRPCCGYSAVLAWYLLLLCWGLLLECCNKLNMRAEYAQLIVTTAVAASELIVSKSLLQSHV
jgi:hypothetical protein